MLVELESAYNMEMNVVNSLTAVLSTVINDPESALEALDPGNLIYGLGYGQKVSGTILAVCDVPDVVEMLLGHYENMDGSCGTDVIEAEDLIVLIYLCRRDLSFYYVTE